MSTASSRSVPAKIIEGLAELLARRPELRGVGISSVLEGMWSQ